MRVKIDGWVWLPFSELSADNIENIQRQLTIYPKKTTDIGSQEKPKPIYLYRNSDDGDYLGIPRGYYEKSITTKHDEVRNITYGAPMQKLRTIYKADGNYAEQGAVLKMFNAIKEDRKWGGFLYKLVQAGGRQRGR